jgi:putative transposase
VEVNRTRQAKITDHKQLLDSLDRHGWSASKLWNVLRQRLRARETELHDIANSHSREVWDETGDIPDHGDLEHELDISTLESWKASERTRTATR